MTLELRASSGLPALLRKTLAIAKVTGMSRFAYGWELFTGTLFLFVVLFTYRSLWTVVARYQDVEALTGYGVPALIWYLAFTDVLHTTSPGFQTLELDREVRTGDLVYRLTRPSPYWHYHLTSYAAIKAVSFLTRAPVLALYALLLVGPISLSFAGVAASLVGVAGAILVETIWTHVVSFLSFWIEDTYGLHLLYRRCVMLLGGLFVPLEAYPPWLRALAEALPFQTLLYGPAKLFLQPDARGLGHLLWQQLTFGTVGLAVMAVLYGLGLKRVSAQGG